MKPYKLSVYELFERHRRYVVPLFQRPYVWSSEKQWEPLWRDITAKAEEVISAATGDPNRRVRDHFLGAVVQSKIQTFGRQVTALDVIDGQQRLTTLQVLLTAFRDYATIANRADLAKSLARLTYNECLMKHAWEAYKVWPTSTDRETFEAVMQAQTPAALQKTFPLIRRRYTNKYLPRPRLVEAYLFFHEAIRTFVEIGNDAELSSDDATVSHDDRLDHLYTAITRHMEPVVIELESDDDPQVIFETLNARGEPLLASDLIRNFVFLEATRNSDDVNTLYETYWQKFATDPFWTGEERQGRSFRPRLELFVFHFLGCQTERDIVISHLFSEFRDWWHSVPRTVPQEMERIQAHSDAFKRFFESDKTPRLGVLASRLRVLDTSTVYPLLLFLVVENAPRVSAEETDGILADLESYLVRRLVCQLTTKRYNRIFLQLLRNLRKAVRVDRAEMQKQLLALEGDSSRWPDDAEFAKHWIYDPIYQRESSSRIAMILGAIDLQQTTTKQEDIHLTYPQLSVEHICPQSPTDAEWPLPTTCVTDAEKEAFRAHRAVFSHRIGNLTLLTKPLNSSVSNGSFSVKRGQITANAATQLNVYFQKFSDTDDWNESTINERGNVLLTTAKTIWAHPGKPLL